MPSDYTTMKNYKSNVKTITPNEKKSNTTIAASRPYPFFKLFRTLPE